MIIITHTDQSIQIEGLPKGDVDYSTNEYDIVCFPSFIGIYPKERRSTNKMVISTDYIYYDQRTTGEN